MQSEQLNLFSEPEEIATEEKKKATKKTTKKENSKSNSDVGKKYLEKIKENKIEKVKYTFPFGIYSRGGLVDITEYGFENGKEYTEEEICNIMLEHKHYEFSADNKSFKYFENDNVLAFTGADFKKG